MSVRDVKQTFARVAQDGKITKQEIDQVMRSVGSISEKEEKTLKSEAQKYASSMDADAKADIREKLGEISSLRRQAASQNRYVTNVSRELTTEAKERLTVGRATKSYGGTPIPDAVKKLVNEAIAGGATAYDVRELKSDPVYDTSHGDGELTIDGKYNPYAQESDPVDSLAFSHTELTPEKIAKDMETEQTWKEINGYSSGGQVAEFKEVTGKPNGRITELYDEATWPDTMARGPGGQKYASNFAILADGSFHAVPASRRYEGNPNLILTTASLARGKHMLFNGHLRMENGVVNYVGLSGRLCKLEDKGDAKFIDPIKLLEAWGFKMAPGLSVTREG